MTIATPHQPYSISPYLQACYTAPLKNTVTALLEYLDLTALLEYLYLTALLEYIDLLNRYTWGPFQAGARGKMPQLPPPLWAALSVPVQLCKLSAFSQVIEHKSLS